MWWPKKVIEIALKDIRDEDKAEIVCTIVKEMRFDPQNN